MSTALKQVYRQGISYNASQDADPVQSTVSTPTPLSAKSLVDWYLAVKVYDNVTVYNRGLTDQEVSELTDTV